MPVRSSSVWRIAVCRVWVPVTEVYLVSPPVDGRNGRRLDVVRGVKVRLTDRQVQDPAPLCLQLTHAGRGGHTCG